MALTHEEFLVKFKTKNPNLFNSLKIIEEYKKSNKPILVQNKYGLCEIRPDSILRGYSPSIQTAIDKNEYWVNMAKEVHGDLYDYSLVNYINNNTKVIIKSIYQTFEISPASHLQGKGCSILGRERTTKYNQNNPLSSYRDSEWIKKALKSKNFDSFKVYIIKCWNKNETFYKVGKTFMTVKQRFNNKKSMPYNYQIIKEIISDNGKYICEFEHGLQTKYKDYKYKPLVKFPGITECYMELPNLYIKRELI
jgi:hypothetical protein